MRFVTLPPRARQLSARLALLALPLGLLAACAEAPPQSKSEQSQYDACHQMADRIVKQANIDALSQNAPYSSPFAATSILPTTTTDLSIEHQRQGIMSDCMRHYDVYAPNRGTVSAYPANTVASQPVPPPPADLAGPSGSDLTKPPILPTTP